MTRARCHCLTHCFELANRSSVSADQKKKFARYAARHDFKRWLRSNTTHIVHAASITTDTVLRQGRVATVLDKSLSLTPRWELSLRALPLFGRATMSYHSTYSDSLGLWRLKNLCQRWPPRIGLWSRNSARRISVVCFMHVGTTEQTRVPLQGQSAIVWTHLFDQAEIYGTKNFCSYLHLLWRAELHECRKIVTIAWVIPYASECVL